MVSGPIVRQEQFLYQLRDEQRLQVCWENICRGLYRFSLGLAKKVLVADTLGKATDVVFGSPGDFYCLSILVGSMAFTLQLYFDFSGYCDMSIGIAKMFNLDLPENFNSPYMALNIKDFWNRWHITLTQFLTKYVYFPLGGSRRGKIRTYVNIMIIFLVSGLWHGSHTFLPFLLWGGMHGAATVLYRRFHEQYDRLHIATQWFLTFSFVSIAWIPFRLSSLQDVYVILSHGVYLSKLGAMPKALLEVFKLKEFGLLGSYAKIIYSHLWVVALAFVVLGLFAAMNGRNTREITEAFRPSFWTGIVTVLLLAWSIMSFSGVGSFIYAGF